MASPSVTYTFTNSTVADADEVNTNFTDIINSLTDGTKDLSISALTCAGAATLNGNVTLGNASSDDVTITGSLASTINIKTTNSYNIGSATLGLAGVYFGNAGGSTTIRLISASSVSSSRTYTFPDAGGSADVVLTAGTQTLTGHKEILGTTTNDDASSGYIGEIQTSNPSSSVTPAASGSFVNIDSISLTAGDWDVEGWGTLVLGTITGLDHITVGISNSSAALSPSNAGGYQSIDVNGTRNPNVGTTMRRVSLSTTTTIYLVGRIYYTTLGTALWNTASYLRARRVR